MGEGGLGKWPRSLYPDTNGKYVFCIAGVPGLILVTMTQTGKYVFCIAGVPGLILVTLTQTGKYVFIKKFPAGSGNQLSKCCSLTEGNKTSVTINI